jgi:hypothetical protein
MLAIWSRRRRGVIERVHRSFASLRKTDQKSQRPRAGVPAPHGHGFAYAAKREVPARSLAPLDSRGRLSLRVYLRRFGLLRRRFQASM